MMSGLGKGLHICLGDDLLRALREDACGVHLARSQHKPLPQLPLIKPQGLLDGLVGDTHAGVAGEEDQIHSHIGGPLCIGQGGLPSVGHGPHIFLGVLAGQDLLHRLEVDADGPSGELLQHPDPLHGLASGQGIDLGIVAVKQIQQQQISSHGGGELRIGHIAQHGLENTHRFAAEGSSLASGDGIQQIPAGHMLKIGAAAVNDSFHKIVSLTIHIDKTTAVRPGLPSKNCMGRIRNCQLAVSLNFPASRWMV